MKYHTTITRLCVDSENLVRADGIALGRLITADNVNYLEIKDRDRRRSQQRGTMLVRVPLAAFAQLAEFRDFLRQVATMHPVAGDSVGERARELLENLT